MGPGDRDAIFGVVGVLICGAMLVAVATKCERPDNGKPSPSASVKPSGRLIEYPDCRDTQPPCLRDEAGTLAVVTDYAGQREALPGAVIVRTEVRGTVRWHTVRLP